MNDPLVRHVNNLASVIWKIKRSYKRLKLGHCNDLSPKYFSVRSLLIHEFIEKLFLVSNDIEISQA